MKRRDAGFQLLVLAIIALLSFAYLLPIYVMLMTALKTPAEITQRTYLLPGANIQIENFVTSWRLIRPAMLNSMLIAGAVTALALLFVDRPGTDPCGADPELPGAEPSPSFRAYGNIFSIHPSRIRRGSCDRWGLPTPDLCPHCDSSLDPCLCFHGDHCIHPGME